MTDDRPLSAAELSAVGWLSDECAAAIASLGPSPAELGHARGWLDCASPAAVELLSITGQFEKSGHADQMLESHCQAMSEWVTETWAANHGALFPPDAMIATLASSMRTAGDDDPEAEDWLWSPLGLPMRGNSARLTGTRRHTAHIMRLNEIGGHDIDPQATLQAAAGQASQIVKASADDLQRLGEARSEAMNRKNDLWTVASAQRSPEAADAAAEGTRAVFDATADCWKHLLIVSAADVEEAGDLIDTLGWVMLTVCRLSEWRTWVGNAIAEESAAAEPEAEPYWRLSLWAAADLILRSLAYPSVYADPDGLDPAVLLAHDLIGRGHADAR